MNPGPTIPEAPETIEAQLEMLLAGRRQAVLLTPGTVLPALPRGLALLSIAEGLLAYRLDGDMTDLRRWQRGDTSLAQLLGYGVEGKPEPARVVVVRGANGVEKQAVVAGSGRLDAATAAAHQVKGLGDTVTVEDGRQVIEDRLKSLDARDLKVRPYHPERDALALQAAARADAHAPLNPTHIIEREGQIVGYFGASSLPLYRLWFHSEKMRASDSLRLLFMIENHYRMAGVNVLGTIIHTESPFYAVAARGGYLESAGDRLFLKDL